MVKQYNRGVGGILGDEMGLGKTLQALTFLATLKDNAVKQQVERRRCMLSDWGDALRMFDLLVAGVHFGRVHLIDC